MKNEHIIKRPGVRRPKRARTEEVARKEADKINDAGKIRVNAYQCSVCEAWHIGTYSKRLAVRMAYLNDTARLELGTRAFSNMAIENFGNQKSRMDHIKRLAMRARERADQWVS